MQEDKAMQKSVFRIQSYNHLLYVPKNYEVQKKWPAIVYLHGVEGKGEYLEILKTHGLPSLLDEQEDFPFIVISPQCPQEQEWSFDRLGKLLDDTAREFKIDEDRVYLTGVGTGATTAWRFAMDQPWRFAALAPVCGSGNPHEVCNLRDVPVWIFHGARDRIHPVSDAQSLVLALKLCGGKVSFTIYPEADHDSWAAAYGDPQLYAWFLEQDRSSYTEPAFDPIAEDMD
jgi:predicted peptidase